MDDRSLIKKITLDAPLVLRERNAVTRDFFEKYPNIRPSVLVDAIGENIVTEIEMVIEGETLEKLEFRYPANWWQAFRERFFPVWYLKRYPVIYIMKVLEARALYPKISLPKQGPKIIFMEDNSIWKKGKQWP